MHSWSRLSVVRSTGEAECWWAPHCHSGFMHRQMESEGSIEHTWQNGKGGVDGKRRLHTTCLTGICLSRSGTRSRWEGSFSSRSMLKKVSAAWNYIKSCKKFAAFIWITIIMLINNVHFEFDRGMFAIMILISRRGCFHFLTRRWWADLVQLYLFLFLSFIFFYLLDLILSEWEFVEDLLVFTRTDVPTAYQTECVSRAMYSHCEFFSGCFAGNTYGTYANTIKAFFGLFHQDGQC